jgi:hypothetical protein
MVLAHSAAPFSTSITDCFDMFIVLMACVWSCHRHDKLMYNAWLACFCMLVQHVVCPAVVEKEKKDQNHDQNVFLFRLFFNVFFEVVRWRLVTTQIFGK